MADPQILADPTNADLSLDETMRQAEQVFHSLNDAYLRLIEERSASPDWVLRESSARSALETAACEVLEARAAVQEVKAEQEASRRVEAAKRLASAEDALTVLVQIAEEHMAVLRSTLSEIITASQTRYGARHVLDGRASRRLLAREAIDGWVRWRLSELALPDLQPDRHQRHKTLAGWLGVETPTTGSDEPSSISKEASQ